MLGGRKGRHILADFGQNGIVGSFVNARDRVQQFDRTFKARETVLNLCLDFLQILLPVRQMRQLHFEQLALRHRSGPVKAGLDIGGLPPGTAFQTIIQALVGNGTHLYQDLHHRQS